ncbi:tigger transposable element-derived protein 1-like isoform X2 [Anolis carolinensis]|uniref:tigger transposable element-derived protein 1-like isoform X2 n=1 Tax=Anolis carolinensis TaxID=28377 RepID=UPI002F2B22AF
MSSLDGKASEVALLFTSDLPKFPTVQTPPPPKMEDRFQTMTEQLLDRKRRCSEAINPNRRKRSRKVLTLSEKVKVLDLIRKEKKSCAEVAKMYSKNESSIREIMRKEKEIRASVAVLPQTAKVTSTLRDKYLVKTEKALNLWIEDMNREGIPIDGNVLRQKALSIYKDFSGDSPERSDSKPFTASKGWLHRFRNRFGLRNSKITADAASFNEEEATAFLAELKKLIQEKGYHPKQVFNCNETGLFWKKMPNRTYIHQSLKEALGNKTWNDKLTLVLCGNTAGHMIKPGVVYRVKNPRTLKNKHYLPVFWQHNKKACITDLLFIEWFHQCFIPEVKKYLQEEGLDFKVLLIIDNSPGHPESIRFEDEDVKVVFLPPNTSALLQPLEQGIIQFVKATYTRLVFDCILSAIDADPNVDIIQCWRSFSIDDAITFIKAAMGELKPETVNACWKNLWSGVVNDCKDFPEIDGDVRKIIITAKQFEGEGFAGGLDEGSTEHAESHQAALMDEKLRELGQSFTAMKEEEEESDGESPRWTMQRFAEVFQIAQTLTDKIMEYDPCLERSTKVLRLITKGLQPLQHHFDELKRKRERLRIPASFQKVLANEPSAVEDPQPLTSSASDIQPLATP